MAEIILGKLTPVDGRNGGCRININLINTITNKLYSEEYII